MSTTNKGTVRSGSRSNAEEMMWQGVRSKAPNLMNNQQQRAVAPSGGEANDRLNMTNDSSHQKYMSGEQSVYQQSTFDASKFNRMMTGGVYGNEGSNFPVPPDLARKHMSLQQPASSLQAQQQFATIVGSDDSIHGGRSQQTSDSRRSTAKQHLKKVDYTDISVAMVRQQQAAAAVKNGSRGLSLRASRFANEQTATDAMFQTVPVHHEQYQVANGNARFGSSIDVNFKRQIDGVKQNRAQSMLPNQVNLQQDGDVPLRMGKQGATALHHNDSIYQSSVNQSINSGLGLTPKRLIDNRTSEQINRKAAAPFGNMTEQKNHGNRVPPILLANENKMKYVGHKHQTQVMQQADFNATPANINNGNANQNFAYSQLMSPHNRQNPQTANGASFLSRDAGSTAYSQPEDSMFQASEASMSQQRSRFPPHVLPKIGSANPEMNARFKRTSPYPDSRSRERSDEQQVRGRQLQTAQPTNGFKFAKNHAQSQQQRSRQNQYNDTGFNWRQVEIRTNTNFDGTGRTSNSKPLGGTSASVNVPAAYRKKKYSPGQLLDMMQQVDHKGPISHKIVNSAEFERLAQQQADADGGKPMVEKTIFIVKPIYIPVEVPATNKSAAVKEPPAFPVTGGKKKIKVKNKVQKAIYMERPKPPNYVNANSTVLDPPKSKKQLANAAKSKKHQSSKHTTTTNNQRIHSQSPSPLSQVHNSHFATEALNQSSIDQGYMNNSLALAGQQDDGDTSSHSRSRSRSKTKRDLKHILESSSVIDEIFAKRSRKLEKQRKKEEEKKQKEDEEYKEVLDANQSLKDSLRAKGSNKSQITLQNQLSGNPSGKPTTTDEKSSTGKPPVDTTKQFLETINDQLHTAGAGIQIVMEESKNASWFLRRQNDEKRINKQYGHVRKWEVAPKTFQATELDADTLNAAKMKHLQRGSAQKGAYTGSLDQNSAQKQRAGSIPHLQNSPSGGEMSDRRWKSPTQQSMNESEALRRAGSYSPRDEPKSPFTARSGRGSMAGHRDSDQQMIAVQDQKDNQLTLERVEAMKIMTKKLKKVAKMPVEFENKFCSHIDPGTSAQLIAADDLANLDKNGKYHNRWKDKNHVAQSKDFTGVPKHFYSNFKTNLIRDAHYMAKRINEHNRSLSPMQNSCLGTCQAAANGGNSIQCNCKPKKKVDLKRRFRSYIGGVRSAARSKNVEKTAYDLYKPYRPCRRTCCANHNPLFHAQRMQQEHLQRMHASATKLMIMSVIPERPYSADSATRALQQYQKEIDYYSTQMHDDAKEKKKQMRLRRMGSKITRRTASIEGIEERGANEEEDPEKSKSMLQSPGLSMGLGSSLNQFTQSNLNMMKGKLDGSFMLDDAISLTAIECKYLLDVMKNRAIQANNIKEKQFAKIYDKARMTLKIQMKKLLLRKQFQIIDKQYKLAENEKQTAENLIKILARIMKMFEAQAQIHKIIIYLEDRLASLREFRQECHQDNPDGEKLLDLYKKLVLLSRRAAAEIRVLKSMEKTLQRPFMFRGISYDQDHMYKQMKRKRLQILTMVPELASDRRIQEFLLEDGSVSSIKNIDRELTQLQESEPLWSESEDEEEEQNSEQDERTELNDSDRKAINRLNTSSNERLEKLNSIEMRRNTSL